MSDPTDHPTSTSAPATPAPGAGAAPAEWLAEALALHQQGDLPRAEQLYRRVLAHEPNHADALHFLGVLAAQAGHAQPALDLIDRAITIDPTAAHFRVNRGNVLRALGRTEDAIDAYHAALDLAPHDVSAYVNLANGLRQAERMEEALDAARAAAQLQEDEADLHNLLGVILADLGRSREAIDAFETALQLRGGDFPDARANLEHARFEAEASEDVFVASADLTMTPPPATAINEAKPSEEVLAGSEASAEASEAAAAEQIEVSEVSDAPAEALVIAPAEATEVAEEPRQQVVPAGIAAALETSVPLEAIEAPDAPPLRTEAADANKVIETARTSAMPEATAAIEATAATDAPPPIAIAPEPPAWRPEEIEIDLGDIVVLKELDPAGADAIVSWRPVAPPQPRRPYVTAEPTGGAGGADDAALSAATHSERLLALHAREHEPAELFDEHRWWNDLHAAALERDAMPHFTDLDPERRLRIGYVMPGPRGGAGGGDGFPVGRFLLPLLERRDRGRADVVVFYTGAGGDDDDVARKLRAEADEWYDVAPLPDDALASAVRDHRIDLLVDLSGHTPGNRLLAFARRPAPVQVTWLGYPDTTGMTVIDYRLTDALADPPGHPSGAFSSESMVRLDDSFLCVRLRDDELPPLERCRRRRIVFGCFSPFAKASPTVMALWGRILTATPGARLLLAGAGMDGEPMITHVRGELRRHGVATDRVELGGAAPTRAAHLALFNRIDLALDTHPFSDAATTADALAMGVPVVTLSGTTHASREGASLLTTAGLANFIARDAEEYVTTATGLARAGVRSLEQRRDLRSAVAASPLCDESRFARKIEDAYRRMWKQFCAR